MFRELFLLASSADIAAIDDIRRARHIYERATSIVAVFPEKSLLEAADALESYYFTLHPIEPDDDAEVHQVSSEKYLWLEDYLNLTAMEYSESALLFNFGDDLVESGLLNLGELKWEHYFAVHALISIGRAIKATQADKSDRTLYLSTKIEPGEYCMEALEAITYAEYFLAIRYRSRAAAAKKHSRINKLKQDFIAYYCEHASISRSEAARRYLQTLPASESKLFAPTNAVRTLTEALRMAERASAAKKQT